MFWDRAPGGFPPYYYYRNEYINVTYYYHAILSRTNQNKRVTTNTHKYLIKKGSVKDYFLFSKYSLTASRKMKDLERWFLSAISSTFFRSCSSMSKHAFTFIIVTRFIFSLLIFYCFLFYIWILSYIYLPIRI